ncbi:MAG: aspartate/methionine/tyrosine aminotransferase [Crocinitomicaceae bacterium]|jgi:aspartate/methionine/tyrosine aminotransferase
MFEHHSINFEILKERAFNLRWATVQDGVIPLTAADPDFPCATEISDSIIEYAKSGYFNYGPTEGLAAFKQALHCFFKEKRDYNLAAEQILPVDSAAFGIQVVCKALLSPGDEAIIFDPVDFLFQFCITQTQGIPIRFPILPGASTVDFALLESLITPKTKLICLCNPLNPTGKVFTREELLELGRITVKHNLVVLSDEIWSDIVFTPHKFTSLGSLSPEISERTITVTGFSKSYGLAGLRTGVIASANKEIYRKLFETSLHTYTVHGANILGQVAGIAALTKAQSWLTSYVSHLEKMRALVTERINQMNGLSTIAPEGCFVSFINIKETGHSAESFQKHMLEKANVLVVPGLSRWFGPGAEGYVRISFATSEEVLTEALNRIEEAL